MMQVTHSGLLRIALRILFCRLGKMHHRCGCAICLAMTVRMGRVPPTSDFSEYIGACVRNVSSKKA
jgi:hypothetical protein